MIIAVDFDGTLCRHEYPRIGPPRKDVIEWVKEKKRVEKAELILWTCRHGKELEEAVQACKRWGIEFDAINDNLERIKKELDLGSPKVFANIYLDDRALNVENVRKGR